MNYGLLKGLRVVESSAFIAAPLAGMTLAQFGADVIRIDLPTGGIDYRRLPMAPEGRSLYWTGMNKGKRSLAIDFRRPEGKEIVRELIVKDDEAGGVLLTNVGGAWLSHASLSELRPDVITCTIEGNSDGSTAVDYTVNSAVGFPVMTSFGSAQAPINHVLPAWDIACAYQAAFAVSAALSRRRMTKQGAEIRLALSDVAFSMLSHLGMSTETEILGRDRKAIGNYLFGAYGKDVGTCDGRRVFVAAISLNQWKNLVKACEMEEASAALQKELGLDFSQEGDRFEAREDITDLVEGWTLRHSHAEVSATFDKYGVCWGNYQSVSEALANDSRLSIANPIFERVKTVGVGEHLAAGTPVRMMNDQRGATESAPLLGQHTDAILMDVLNLDSAVVGRLHDDGVVAGPEKDPLVGRYASRAGSY